MSVPKTVARNLVWGALWGMCGGVVYSIYAVLVLILRGPAAFEANGTSFPAVIGAYLGGGAAAGLILGILRPFTRSWLGSAILGALCAVPVFSAGRIALSGFSSWTRDDWRGIALLAGTIGSLAGLVFRYEALRLDREDGVGNHRAQ